MAHAAQSTRSGRFIKAYLAIWGLLAALALGYLATLAWHPERLPWLDTRPRITVPQPDPAIQAASKALAEVGTIRRSVSDIEKDLGGLKDTIEAREEQEKAVHTRLSALEERVASIATPPPASPAPVAAKQKAPDKPQRVAAHGEGEMRSPVRTVVSTADIQTAATSSDGPPVPLETSSIASSQPIVFGEPVVTRARAERYGVQLGAGPSVDAVRLSWGQLVERHGPVLGKLQPRVIAPRSQGGAYRLVAGPLATKAEADRVCAQMRVGRAGCFSTTFIGEPLAMTQHK